MKIIEQYYGPVRDKELFPEHHPLKDRECYIRVEVNGRQLHVKKITPKEVPAKFIMRDCRKAIMADVEREVFGD